MFVDGDGGGAKVFLEGGGRGGVLIWRTWALMLIKFQLGMSLSLFSILGFSFMDFWLLGYCSSICT